MRTLRTAVLALLAVVAVTSVSGCYRGYYRTHPTYRHGWAPGYHGGWHRR